MLKEQKEQIVAELVERLRSTDTLIVADYRGLTMKRDRRGSTRAAPARGTLLRRQEHAHEAGSRGGRGRSLKEFLDGPTAIAFVGDGDMVAVAKTLSDTARRTKVLAVKGGILQGQTISAEEVRDLAALPPLDVLQGQIVGAVAGPLNAVVGLFTAPLRDLVDVLDARIQQLQEQEA